MSHQTIVQSKQEPQGRPISSVYPLHPRESRFLVRTSGSDLTLLDRVLVAGSSLFIVGSVAWVPLCIAWSWRRWHRVTDKRRKALYAGLTLAALALAAVGPHRSPRFGRWVRLRKWNLWTSWMRFVAMEVILDSARVDSRRQPTIDVQKDNAILAFSPHGIFPFSIAFPAILPQMLGDFRPVVATATAFFPIVRDILSWLEAVYVGLKTCACNIVTLLVRLLTTLIFLFRCSDASRSSVSQALAHGDRIGIALGGIAEIFEGYPKPSTHPDEEYSIVRTGFLRLAIEHGIPVIPIYCFGATKMLRRLNIPVLEHLSRWMRFSVCVFYGAWGLPIPFRQRISYVIGDPIHPPRQNGDEDCQIGEMHELFCDELSRIFDRHKEAYGWGHKTLRLLKQ
jgi:hypothetical protein